MASRPSTPFPTWSARNPPPPSARFAGSGRRRSCLELGFHDNPDDAQWIVTHIDAMAESIVLSLTEYFGIPFFPDSYPLPGEVRAELGAWMFTAGLTLTRRPSPQLYDGAR